MRSSSTSSKKKRPLPGSKNSQKYSDFFDSKTAIERIAAERQSRDAGLNLLYGLTSPSDKSRLTSNKTAMNEVNKSRSYVTNSNYKVVGRNDAAELDKSKLNDLLSNTQKDLQITRENLLETQSRYEKMVKDLKYYINEIESENLKLTKELTVLKQASKRDVTSTQDRDSKLLNDYSKKTKDLEDQCKFYVQENIKLKQTHEKESQSLKFALKEAENKVESFKRDFASFHNKNKKDNDDLAFKEEYIRKMQDGIKEKSKMIFDLRQANEQYIKFLEEKDGRIHVLEKDLKKEKESSKFYADRLNEMMIEKINEGKKSDKDRGKSLINCKKNPGIKSNQSFDPEFSHGKISGRGEIDERKSTSFNEADARIQGLQQENSFLRKEIKEISEKYRASEEANKAFKSLTNKSFKKDATPRSRKSENSPFEHSKEQIADLQSKFSEVNREKEMLNKCLLDKSCELDSLHKKSSEYEEMIKSMHHKIERILEEKEELLEERKIFQKKSRNEQELMNELSNIQESIIRGLRILEIKSKVPKKSLTEDLDQVWSKIIKILQDSKELDENLERLDEENQFLNEENLEMKARIEEFGKLQEDKDGMIGEFVQLQEKMEVLNDYEKKLKVIKDNVKNLKLFVGLSFEDRGFENIDDDLADVLIEVQKIIESEKDANEQLQKVFKENEKIREKVKDLQESKDFYESAGEEISVLQEKLKDYEDKNEELSSQIKSLTQENESLEELLLQESQKLELSKESTLLLMQENQDLQDYKQKFETLSQELNENSISRTSQKSKELTQENLKPDHSNNESFQTSQEKLQESQSEVESLKQKLELFEKERNTFQDFHEQITQEKDLEIHQLKDLKAKYQRLSEELQKENQEFNVKIKETENLSESYTSLKASNEKLVQDYENLNSEYKSLTERFEYLSEIHEDMSKKQDSFLKTEENYKDLQEDYAKLLEKSEKNSEIIENLSYENSQLIKSNEDLVLNSSRSVNTEDLSRELQQLQQENLSLQGRLSNLSDKLSRKRVLSSQVDHLTEENQNLSVKLDNLLEQSSILEKEKTYMSEKLQEMQNLIEKKEVKLEKFRVGSRSLERKLSRTETKTQQVISKLDKEKQELFENLRNEYKEEIEGLKEKNNKLSTENFELEEENARKEEEITKLMEELSGYRKELKKAIKENAGLEDRIEEMREEIRRNSNEVLGSEESRERFGKSALGDEEIQPVEVKIDYEEKVVICIEYVQVEGRNREEEFDRIVKRLEEQIRDLENEIKVLEDENRRIKENEDKSDKSGKSGKSGKSEKLTELVELDIKFSPNLDISEENNRLKKEIERITHKNDEIENLDLIIEYQSTENIQELILIKEKLNRKKVKIESLKGQVQDLLAESSNKADVLDEEINLLKKEIENKNIEIERLTVESNEWQMKYNKLAFSESSPSSGSGDE